MLCINFYSQIYFLLLQRHTKIAIGKTRRRQIFRTFIKIRTHGIYLQGKDIWRISSLYQATIDIVQIAAQQPNHHIYKRTSILYNKKAWSKTNSENFPWLIWTHVKKTTLISEGGRATAHWKVTTNMTNYSPGVWNSAGNYKYNLFLEKRCVV